MGNSGKKLTRRERERLARRHEILKAARKVFGKYGYEGATLDEVAREAEFAKGTLYSYFDSKAELFAALVEHEFDELVAQVRETLGREQGAAASVREVFRVLLEFFESRNDFYRVAMAHRYTGKREDIEKVLAVVSRRLGELDDLLSERLAEGVRGGDFKEYDPKFLGFFLLGLVHYYSVCAFKCGCPENLAGGADMLCDIYLDGVRKRRPEAPEDK